MCPKTVETLWAVLNERDNRYQQRFEAQERALQKAEQRTDQKTGIILASFSMLLSFVAVAIQVLK